MNPHYIMGHRQFIERWQTLVLIVGGLNNAFLKVTLCPIQHIKSP